MIQPGNNPPRIPEGDLETIVNNDFLPGAPTVEYGGVSPADLQEVLMGSVRRCDYYATDEFRITREDGKDQGIFKVWAAPIIPVLDTGKPNVGVALEAWRQDMRGKPFSLFESLEERRSFLATYNRRLQLRSLERPGPVERASVHATPEFTYCVTALDELPELNGHRNVELRLSKDIDLDRFQGTLFRWIIGNRGKIQKVTLEKRTPTTSHFTNIIESLGIGLDFVSADNEQ